jgi:hypothetical protein
VQKSWLFIIALLLGAVFQVESASATLLFSGGEDVDFICVAGASCGVVTTSYTFRSPWARESYEVGPNGADPPTNRFSTPALTATPIMWVHAQYCADSGGCQTSTTNNYQMIRVLDSSGNAAILVRGSGTAAQLKISSRTSSGTFTDLATCPTVLVPHVTQLDLYINYGTSGEVALYGNGIKECDFSGDVTNGDGATTLDQVEFSGPSGTGSEWSEVIVATTDTRAMSRYSATTVANGAETQFSGTNICSAIWNATSANDNNNAYADTANLSQECTVKSQIPAGSYDVVGLVMSARAAVGPTGPQHFEFLTRTDGADYASGDYAPLPTPSNITNYIQAVNPATSAAWAVSDFTDPGFNIGEKSTP